MRQKLDCFALSALGIESNTHTAAAWPRRVGPRHHHGQSHRYNGVDRTSPCRQYITRDQDRLGFVGGNSAKIRADVADNT
jgi:hypothetical protein